MNDVEPPAFKDTGGASIVSIHLYFSFTFSVLIDFDRLTFCTVLVIFQSI